MPPLKYSLYYFSHGGIKEKYFDADDDEAAFAHAKAFLARHGYVFSSLYRRIGINKKKWSEYA